MKLESLNKENIKKIPNIPGIYYIRNKINNKGYIGKSIHLRRRLYEHIYNVSSNKDKDKVLYKAFNKYGIENFEFIIIHIILYKVENINDKLFNLEIKYIKLLNTYKNGYNLTKGGDGVSGKIFSEEEKQKMRNRYFNNSPLLRHSQECKCITYSYNLDTQEIKIFNSRKDAALYLINLGYKSSDSLVIRVINEKIKQHHNHIFANSLEDLNIKIRNYYDKLSVPKLKIDYNAFYNLLLKYVDIYGVLPTIDNLEILLNLPRTNISRRILKLLNMGKLIKISILSRPRIALSTVDKELFVTKVKLTNLETGEITVISDEECSKFFQCKLSTVKRYRTNHTIIKNFLLESCCMYSIINNKKDE